MSRFNEYYGGPTPSVRTTGALTATKLRNQLNKLRPGLITTQLRNIRINGALNGCCGVISNTAGTRHVYVCADRTHNTGNQVLYRTTTGPGDYTGGRNRFTDKANLAQAVVDLLEDDRAYAAG